MPYGARSARTVPLPKDWPARVKAVRRRDAGTCQQCGSTERPEVDHVGDPNDHSLDNLRILCRACHRRRSAGQGGTAAAANRIPRARPRERHPGLL